jgi:hypothetical protein
MATKPINLESVAGTPAYDEYVTAQKAIKDILAERENRLFDPTLLAMAQGFLAPTKTGSFGESLGNVAGALAPVQQAEDKRSMENAQMRLQMAQMNVEQARKQKAQDLVGGLFPKPVGAPAGAPAGAPVGATTGAPAGAPSGAQPAAAGQMRSITGQDIFAISQLDKDLGSSLAEAVKLDRDRFKISQNGIVFDTATERYLNIPIPGQTQSEFSTPYGTYKMTPNEYAQLGDAISKGQGREWMDMWRKGQIDVTGKPIGAPPAPAPAPAPSAAPSAPSAAPPAPPSAPVAVGRQTTSESEAAAAALRETATKTAAAKVAQTTEVKDAAKAAVTLIPLYDRADKLLKTPNIGTALGVLEKPDFLAQIGTIADEGIRVGPYAINAPSVRKIVTNFTQDQNVINALTELGQVEAMWQFVQRKGLGSGTSVSNMEQQLVNAMGPNFKDPKDAYVKKLQFMREKAIFEQKLGRELNRTGKQYEDYENSEDFERLFSDYRNRLERIGEVKVPKVGGPVNPAAGDALRKKIGLP